MDDILTTKEAAQYLKGVSIVWIRDHAKELGGVKLRGQYRFLREDLIKYLRSLQDVTAPDEDEYIRG